MEWAGLISERYHSQGGGTDNHRGCHLGADFADWEIACPQSYKRDVPTTDMTPLSGTAIRDEPRSSIIMKPSRRGGLGHGPVAHASGKPAAPAFNPDALSTRALAACLLPATWRI